MPEVGIGIVCEWPPKECGQRKKPMEIKTYVPDEDMEDEDAFAEAEKNSMDELARRLYPVFAEYNRLNKRKNKNRPHQSGNSDRGTSK